MLTAQVKINGKIIHNLSAGNIGIVKEKPNSQWRRYKLECGCELKHNRDKGALCLLIQMTGHSELCKKSAKNKKLIIK